MKEKLKVLLVAYYFPPMGGVGSIRVLKFLKYLKRKGVKVDIVTVSNPPYPLRDDSLLEEIPEEVKITRIKFFHPLKIFKNYVPTGKKKGILFHMIWPDYAIWSIPSFLKFIKKVRKNYSVVLLSMPPFAFGILAWWIKKKFRIPTVLDFRDPWVGNPFIENNLFKKLLNKLWEEKTIKIIDAVTVVTKAHKNFLCKVYKDNCKKIFYIPHGYDPDDYIFKGYPSKGKKLLTLFYAGRIGGRQHSLKYMIEALRILNHEKKIKTVLVIAGTIDENIKDFKYIKPLGFIKRKHLFRLMTKADILWCDYKVSYSDFIVPSKFYEYIGLGKPILLTTEIEEYEGVEILKKSKKGLWAKRDAPEDIADKILKLSQMKVKSTEIKEYSREFLTEKLMKVLEWVVK